MGSHVIHVEVLGKDGAALQRFYGDVLGWTFDTDNPGGYGMARGVGEGDLAAGIGTSSDGGPGHVTFYVHADDAQAVLDRAVAAGGRVIMPLTQIAPETTIGLFADPEGHVVGIM
jgi:predicted enzyme related to lactoylglutathione lyase